MALSGTAKVSFDFTQTKTPDNTTATAKIQHALSLTFTDGNAAGNADRIWTDTRTLAASASESLDFSGSLTNVYGDTAIFADVRAILVTAASGNTNNVNVTRDTTSPESGLPLFLASGDGLAVRPGGFLAVACPDATGYPVTAATADRITFTNSAGSTEVTYTVTVIGSSV
jgi:hypothetical protein